METPQHRQLPTVVTGRIFDQTGTAICIYAMYRFNGNTLLRLADYTSAVSTIRTVLTAAPCAHDNREIKPGLKLSSSPIICPSSALIHSIPVTSALVIVSRHTHKLAVFYLPLIGNNEIGDNGSWCMAQFLSYSRILCVR